MDGSVSLSPPPPYFPSELLGHLAALAETTGVFPLGCLVVCRPVYLSVGSHCPLLDFSSCLSFIQPAWPTDSFSLRSVQESRDIISPPTQHTGQMKQPAHGISLHTFA